MKVLGIFYFIYFASQQFDIFKDQLMPEVTEQSTEHFAVASHLL